MKGLKVDIGGISSLVWGYIISLLTTIVGFLLPAKVFLLIIGMVVAMDTIVGIYTTIKLRGRKSYQSTKLFNLAVKTFFYGGSICFLYCIDYFIVGVDGVFGISLISTKAATLFFVYIECKSMDEKSQKLGNEPFYKIVKNLLNRLKEFKKDLNEILDFDDKKE